MTGFVVDFRRGGKDMFTCYVSNTTDLMSAALGLARRYEVQGNIVTAVTVLEGVEGLAAVEDAAHGPTPGTISQVLMFDDEEASA